MNTFMSTSNQDSALRMIFKSEITWLIGLVAAIGCFFYNVVIPINTIQIQLVQIQAQLGEVQILNGKVTQNTTDITVVQQEIKVMQQQLKTIK